MPKVYGVSIKPKLKEDKESFSLAFVNLDRKYSAAGPDHLEIARRQEPEGLPAWADVSQPAVNDKNFEGKPLGPPWKIVRNPTGEERPRPGVNRAQPRRHGRPRRRSSRADGIERQ